MPIPHRKEFHHFQDDADYAIDGFTMNRIWRLCTILCAGEMNHLSPNERRDLGQEIQAKIADAINLD